MAQGRSGVDQHCGFRPQAVKARLQLRGIGNNEAQVSFDTVERHLGLTRQEDAWGLKGGATVAGAGKRMR